jgi:integrase
MADKANALVSTHSLPSLLAIAAEAAEAKRTSATRRGYAADWRAFQAWAAPHGLATLPARPETIVAYLAHLSLDHKIATIDRAVSALRRAHKDAAVEWPDHPAIRETLKGLRRKLRTAQRKATPLQDTDLAAMLLNASARDRALVLLGWAAALRRSELVALVVDDVVFSPDGLMVTLRSSKTDQEGEGQVCGVSMGRGPLCPVRALWKYLAEAGIAEGRIFPISDRTASEIVKRLAKSAGLDADLVSGHSLRSGFATTAAIKGKSLASIMKQTRHKSERVALGYIRAATIWQDNASEGLL